MCVEILSRVTFRLSGNAASSSCSICFLVVSSVVFRSLLSRANLCTVGIVSFVLDGFRFSVFAISIPRLRTHAGVVASSRLVRRDLYSVCFPSVPPTAARPGSAPQATCYSAVLRIRATFKARLERCLGVWSGPRRARRRVFRLPDLLVRPTRPRASSRRRRRLVEFALLTTWHVGEEERENIVGGCCARDIVGGRGHPSAGQAVLFPPMVSPQVIRL